MKCILIQSSVHPTILVWQWPHQNSLVYLLERSIRLLLFVLYVGWLQRGRAAKRCSLGLPWLHSRCQLLYKLLLRLCSFYSDDVAFEKVTLIVLEWNSDVVMYLVRNLELARAPMGGTDPKKKSNSNATSNSSRWHQRMSRRAFLFCMISDTCIACDTYSTGLYIRYVS